MFDEGEYNGVADFDSDVDSDDAEVRAESRELKASAGGTQALRILMLAPCPFPTSQGSQTLIRQLAAGLQHRGHEVHLVTYHHSEYREEFDFGVSRTPYFPGTSRLKAGPSLGKLVLDLFFWHIAMRVAGEINPHLVHGHNYEGAILGHLVAKKRGIPLIYHTHNVMHEELPTYFHQRPLRFLARKVGLCLDNWIPRHADQIIAINRALRRELVTMGIDPERIRIVPPGIWPAEWERAVEPRQEPLVVYTGNLDNYQNLSLLIEGIRLVKQRIPGATLKIVSHETRPRLEREARKLGMEEAVEFIKVDTFSQVKAWILRAAVVVCPRIPTCGYPIKLVNYLAAGRPVVVSEASADGIVDGESGLVVETGNPAAYAEGIIKLLTDRALATRIAREGRRLASEKHSWDRSLAAIEASYRAALTGVKL